MFFFLYIRWMVLDSKDLLKCFLGTDFGVNLDKFEVM